MSKKSKRPLTASSKAYSNKQSKKYKVKRPQGLLYRNFYYIGINVMRHSHHILRKAKAFLTPIKDFSFMLFQRGVVNRFNRLRDEFGAVKNDFSYAAKRMRIAKERGFGEVLVEPLRLITDGIRKHRSFVSKLFNVLAPAISIVLLVLTINFYMNRNYVLQVQYGNEQIGYVANEGVYTQAAEMISDRIVGDAKDVHLEKEPTFKLSVGKDEELLEPREVCDTVLGLTGGEIEEAYGLVVNNELVGAIRSQGDIQFLLDDFLDAYKSDAGAKRVEFIDDIQVEHGYYPVSNIKDATELKSEITTTHPTTVYYTIKKGDSPIAIANKNDMTVEDLKEMNPDLDSEMYPGARVKVQKDKPVLGVKSIGTNVYYKTLAFSTKTEKDSSQYTDYKQLKTKGVAGKERFEEEITYIDGDEVSRKLINRVVESNPIDAVYTVGTKERPQPPKPKPPVVKDKPGGGSGGSQGGDPSDPSVGKGKFAWPVPGVRTISSPFGMRNGRMHQGIDISCSGIKGRAIVAAASGTVTTKAYDSGGYGNYIIITHANGYSTRYGHCLSISVSQGQQVSKGQKIATVGSTGRSTGPHLHFEIRVNGTAKNPMNYY